MLRLYLFFSHEERLRDEAPGGVGAGQAPAMRVRKARDCSSQMFSPGAAASDVFLAGWGSSVFRVVSATKSRCLLWIVNGSNRSNQLS
jgi:hypothetical protein